MLRWKVCGITRETDALAAVEAGADAVGFVFYPPSPRAIDPARAASIAAVLPPSTWRVGVFVNATAEQMADVVDVVGLDFLQLSGDESPRDCQCLARHAIKVLRFGSQASPERAMNKAAEYPECTLLVDAAGDEYGGSGRPANRAVAAHLAGRHRLILAGGLTPANVIEAVEEVMPWGVDVSSGVESSPGRKDRAMLEAFARAVERYR